MVKPKYKGRSTINPSKASTNPGTGGGARGGWSLEEAWWGGLGGGRGGRRDTRAALLGVASSPAATGDEKGEGGFFIRRH